MSEPITREQALSELRTRDPEVRQNGLMILSEYQDQVVTDAILEVLSQIDTSQRGEGYTVAQIIGELAGRGETRAVGPIIEILKRDLDNGDDHQIQATACSAFIDLKATDALPFLREALFEKDWDDLEDEVAETLASVGGEAEEKTLLKALASRKKRLKIAALTALRRAGTKNAIKVVERAAKSKDGEVRSAALLTLTRLDADRADEHFGAALANATEYVHRSDIVGAICQNPTPDLLPRLIAIFDEPDWEPLRFDILDLLVEAKHPQAEETINRVRNAEDPSPWPRVHAGALLLKVRYDDSVVAELLSGLAQFQYQDGRDASFNRVNEAGNAALYALTECTVDHPRRFLESILLFDDLRRERIATYARGKWEAGAVIKKIVGSEHYRAYDEWVAAYRQNHDLADVVSPAATIQAPPDDEPVPPDKKKPWWKVW